MTFIEPDGVDLEVIPTHFTKKEAAELADFIAKYKADQKNAKVTFTVEVKGRNDFDFITNLLQRQNLKWAVPVG